MKELSKIFCAAALISFIFATYAYSGTPDYSDAFAKEIKNKVGQYLQSRNFAELEKMVTQYLSQKNEENSRIIYLTYYYIAKTPNILKVLDEWCEKSSGSHIPFTARGNFYVYYAWDARGSGYGHTVSDIKMELFQKRLLQAKNDLELAYTKNTDDANAPAMLINVATGLGLSREYMETQFNNAVKADPFNFRAYSAKLEYLMPKWHGSKEEATAFVNEIKKTIPEGSRRRLLIATFYSSLYNKKDLYVVLRQDEKAWIEIQQEFQKYLSVHPEDILAHNEFSELAFYAGKYETALQEFEIIKGAFDEEIWTKERFNAAKTVSKFFLLIDKGDWKAAEEELAVNPGVRNFEYIVGRFQNYGDTGGFDLFLNKLKDSGRVAQYHMLKGLFFEKENKIMDALAEYNNALQLNPLYSEAYVNAGHAYEKRGNIRKAMSSYQKGIDTDPKNAVAYYDLGRVYEDALENHVQAISFLETAISIAPENGDWYYLIGKAYENINNHNKCIESWEKYLKMEPNGRSADFIRGFLPRVRAGLTE